jgi:zinc transporter
MPLIVPLNRKAESLHENVTWVDIDVSTPEDQRWLESESGLKEETRQLLAQAITTNRRETLEDGLFVSLYGINPDESTDRHEFVSLRLLLQAQRIVTAHTDQIQGIQGVQQEIEAENGPQDSAGFLAMVAIQVAERMEKIITEISGQTDELEDRILEDEFDPPLEEMNALRRRVFRVRRHLAHLKNLLDFIVSDSSIRTDPAGNDALRDASSRVARYLESIEDTRQRTQLIFDQVQTQLSETMSRATFNLTIIATVFLPLSFLTGLLGVNVAGIPEEHNPWGFWIICLILSAVAILSVVFLRWKRWM